jgi:hypothetical protein
MTRNWIVTASRSLSIGRSSTALPGRRRFSFCLESLEQRLSLSSFGCKMAPADLNPQPLLPGYVHVASMGHGPGGGQISAII